MKKNGRCHRWHQKAGKFNRCPNDLLKYPFSRRNVIIGGADKYEQINNNSLKSLVYDVSDDEQPDQPNMTELFLTINLNADLGKI